MMSSGGCGLAGDTLGAEASGSSNAEWWVGFGSCDSRGRAWGGETDEIVGPSDAWVWLVEEGACPDDLGLVAVGD